MPAVRSPLTALLRTGSGASLMVVGLVAKFPASMLALSLVIAVADRWDRSFAGFTVTALTLGVALTGPQRGRAADRHGPRAVLWVLGAGHSLAVLALFLATRSEQMAPAVLGFAFLAGATTPPIMPVLRAMWQRTLSDEGRRHAAQTWESISVDVAYVVAPSVVAMITGIRGPAFSLPVIAALGVVTCAWLGVATSGAWQAVTTSRVTRARRAPLGGEVWRATLVSGFTAVSLSAAELGAVAVTEDVGRVALSGVLIAVLSATSIIGGLVYAQHRPPGSRRAHLRAAATVWVAGTLTVVVWSATLLAAGVGLAVAGLGLAVLMTTQYQIAGESASTERQTEVFAWMATTTQVGFGLGAAISGQLTSQHVFLLSAIAAVLAAAVAPDGAGFLKRATGAGH